MGIKTGKGYKGSEDLYPYIAISRLSRASVARVVTRHGRSTEVRARYQPSDKKRDQVLLTHDHPIWRTRPCRSHVPYIEAICDALAK